MIVDDKPTHLIERAAARLRQPAVLEPAPAAAPAPANPPPPAGLAPEPDPVERGRRPAIIDDLTLVKGGLIDWESRGTRIYEELSIAQSNLLRYSFDENGAVARSGNLVMVTSALAGEGKSFISLNLAAALAQQAERQVLLIDGDAKPNSLGHVFGLSEAPGLLDLAKGDRDLADLVIPTTKANLEFLPLGGGGTLLSQARIAGLVEEIGRRAGGRLIILDTPPCLSSSDPHTLAPIVGQTVFVIAAGLTQQGDIDAALDLVQTCPVVSLLLNKIKLWSGRTVNSYGYHAVARG